MFHGAKQLDDKGNPGTPGGRGPKLATIGAVRRELSRVYRAINAGRMDSSEGCRRSSILQTLAKLIADSDLEARLVAVEAKLFPKKRPA